MSWQWWHNFSTVFRDISVGIGALFGVIGALKVLFDSMDEAKHRRYRSKWEKRFSKERFEKGELALYKLGSSNKIYGIDKTDMEKWWIKPLSTLHDLGYTGEDAEIVVQSDLDKYDEGNPIDFRGNL